MVEKTIETTNKTLNELRITADITKVKITMEQSKQRKEQK